MPRILDNVVFDPIPASYGSINQNIVTFTSDAALIANCFPGDVLVNNTAKEEYFIRSVDSNRQLTLQNSLKTTINTSSYITINVSKVRKAFGSDRFTPFYAVEIGPLAGSTYLRMWTGLGDIQLSTSGGTQTFNGGGTLLELSNSLKEVSRTEATGVDIKLALTSQNLRNLILNNSLKDKDVTVYLGIFDGETDPIGSVYFTGFVDITGIRIAKGAEFASIVCENDILKLSRRKASRYTSGYQNGVNKTGYGSDRGFDFVESLQNKRFNWGV